MQILRACPSVADQQHALFNNSHGHNAVVFPWDGGHQKKIFLKVNIFNLVPAQFQRFQ
jgi:hypothetical protein